MAPPKTSFQHWSPGDQNSQREVASVRHNAFPQLGTLHMTLQAAFPASISPTRYKLPPD